MMEPEKEKLASILQKNGLNRIEARTLVVFRDEKPKPMVEIERTAGLRQPEVSNATQELRNKKYLVMERIPLEGKGRPFHKLKLARPFLCIVKDIAERRAQEIKNQENQVIELLAVV
jgi:predicted transcriptional regulator